MESVVVGAVVDFVDGDGVGQVSLILAKIQSRAILVFIRLPSNVALKC